MYVSNVGYASGFSGSPSDLSLDSSIPFLDCTMSDEGRWDVPRGLEIDRIGDNDHHRIAIVAFSGTCVYYYISYSVMPSGSPVHLSSSCTGKPY
jgi:hypothetical protein